MLPDLLLMVSYAKKSVSGLVMISNALVHFPSLLYLSWLPICEGSSTNGTLCISHSAHCLIILYALYEVKFFLAYDIVN